jgi:ankyrin repeat protein
MNQRGGVLMTVAALATMLLVGAVTPADSPLLDATKRGDVAGVRSLLAEGADPNVAQGDGLTALHLAAQEGSLEIAEILLGAGAMVEAQTRIGGYTPLHLASQGAHDLVVSALLEAGANAGAVATTTGVTPLHLAARAFAGEGTVKALLEHGAPVDARESAAGQTALMFSASYGRTVSVRELLSQGADPAISTEVVDVLKRVIIDKAASERLRDASTEVRNSSPEGTDRELTATEIQTSIAAQRDFLRSDVEIEELLEGFTPDDLVEPGPSWDTPRGDKSEVEVGLRPRWETWVGKTGGMTALLHAAREGRMEAVEALLDGGADIDQVSGDGSSALLIATINGQFDLAMLLIGRGANPDLATTTDGVSPLFAVLQTQWASVYTESYVQPRAQDNLETEYMEVLGALLDAGADPDVQLKTHLWYWEYVDGPSSKMGLDITGATPFWRAAFAQDVVAMKLLAEHGADVNIPTALPDPGLRNGVGGSGRQSDGRIMEDSGLPIMPEGTPNMYPIHAAAGGGYMGLGAFLVNNVPNNFVNSVQYLVEEHGADVNLPDVWGYTPLHYGAVRGGNDLINYLVSKGADISVPSRLGQSAVDMARGGRAGYFDRAPYPQTVELLRGLGSPLLCLNTHFRGTGDYCAGSGTPPFAGAGVEEFGR